MPARVAHRVHSGRGRYGDEHDREHAAEAWQHSRQVRADEVERDHQHDDGPVDDRVLADEAGGDRELGRRQLLDRAPGGHERGQSGGDAQDGKDDTHEMLSLSWLKGVISIRYHTILSR
ncbi:MAG: hypothetical protein JWN49_578 [Parcubacteria group bacterium]|nr:hypothetical protein [Parcubacteria group bacterium]